MKRKQLIKSLVHCIHIRIFSLGVHPHLFYVGGAAAFGDLALQLVRHPIERFDITLRVAQHRDPSGYHLRFHRSEIRRHLRNTMMRDNQSRIASCESE